LNKEIREIKSEKIKSENMMKAIL